MNTPIDHDNLYTNLSIVSQNNLFQENNLHNNEQRLTWNAKKPTNKKTALEFIS